MYNCDNYLEIDKPDLEKIHNRYEEKYEMISNDGNVLFNNYKIVSFFKSKRDTVNDSWETYSSSDYLSIKEIDDKIIQYEIRYMNVAKGGLQKKKGIAKLSCDSCILKYNYNREGNAYYRVKEYITKNDSEIILITLDSIHRIYASVSYFEKQTK